MLDIWYINIDSISFAFFEKKLKQYPVFFQNEVKKYRSINDQKRKLFGRELIRYYLDSNEYNISMDSIQLGSNKKPFIANAPFFNISHSGSYVVAAFNETPVGIDIEKEKEIDVYSLSSYFHVDEIKYLRENNFLQACFYKLWVRKEAYLKALGTGLMKGLDTISVLSDVKSENIQWSIWNIDINIGYQCAVCSNPTQKINKREIILNEINH